LCPVAVTTARQGGNAAASAVRSIPKGDSSIHLASYLADRDKGVNARWRDVMCPGKGKRLGSGLGDYELLALDCWRHSSSSSRESEEQSFAVRPKSLILTAKQRARGNGADAARRWGETRSKSTPRISIWWRQEQPSGSGSGDAATEEAPPHRMVPMCRRQPSTR
jgi:hypothetical protein